jgi:alpha-N-arabinofuranosidase
MGIGLGDSRGWNQTHSGIALDRITTDWSHLEATYSLGPQTPAVDLTARLMADKQNVSGTLQVHNLVLREFVSGHDAAYPLLTSSASTSSDGRRLYLMVFNKSANDSIPTTIRLTGFSPMGAQYWEVYGPSLNATTGVAETVTGAPLALSDAGVAHVFPAHSLTAIEFQRSPLNLVHRN